MCMCVCSGYNVCMCVCVCVSSRVCVCVCEQLCARGVSRRSLSLQLEVNKIPISPDYKFCDQQNQSHNPARLHAQGNRTTIFVLLSLAAI